MKVLIIAAIGFVALILAFVAGALVDGVDDFRSNVYTETFDGATSAGVTSANVQLDYYLWKDNLSNASVISNDTDDSPYLSSYNATSRQVTISGLAEDTSGRQLEVTYKSTGLTEYGGAEGFALSVPTIIMVLIIVIAISGVIFIIVVAVRAR